MAAATSLTVLSGRQKPERRLQACQDHQLHMRRLVRPTSKAYRTEEGHKIDPFDLRRQISRVVTYFGDSDVPQLR